MLRAAWCRARPRPGVLLVRHLGGSSLPTEQSKQAHKKTKPFDKVCAHARGGGYHKAIQHLAKNPQGASSPPRCCACLPACDSMHMQLLLDNHSRCAVEQDMPCCIATT
jgi:hypothetical protein